MKKRREIVELDSKAQAIVTEASKIENDLSADTIRQLIKETINQVKKDNAAAHQQKLSHPNQRNRHYKQKKNHSSKKET